MLSLQTHHVYSTLKQCGKGCFNVKYMWCVCKGVSIWYPLLKQGKELTEDVIHHASKLIPGIVDLQYPHHLHGINIPSMNYHRIKGEIIQVYKIPHGEDESLKALFDVLSTSIARGHKFKKKKSFVKNKVPKHLFRYRR